MAKQAVWRDASASGGICLQQRAPLAWLKLLMMTALVPNCDAECKSADMIRRGVSRLVPWDGGPEWMEADGHFDVVV